MKNEDLEKPLEFVVKHIINIEETFSVAGNKFWNVSVEKLYNNDYYNKLFETMVSKTEVNLLLATKFDEYNNATYYYVCRALITGISVDYKDKIKIKITFQGISPLSKIYKEQTRFCTKKQLIFE